MSSARKPKPRKPSAKSASLASRARANKRLFLPMAPATADAAATRFRIALNMAAAGRAGVDEVRALTHAVMMAGLIDDADPGMLADSDLLVCEAALTERLRATGPVAQWALAGDALSAMQAVINGHDRQFRQCRFQTIVVATERFERLALLAQSTEQIFEARRSENARKAKRADTDRGRTAPPDCLDAS